MSDEAARDLTPAMRQALRTRQEDLLEDRATVVGPGMTMKALRQRGLVAGAIPRAIITPAGREVVNADPEIRGGPT